MINALMMIAGAAVFFGGFLTGLHFDTPKPSPDIKQGSGVTGEVVCDPEYRNFLRYDGTEKE